MRPELAPRDAAAQPLARLELRAKSPRRQACPRELPLRAAQPALELSLPGSKAQVAESQASQLAAQSQAAPALEAQPAAAEPEPQRLPSVV